MVNILSKAFLAALLGFLSAELGHTKPQNKPPIHNPQKNQWIKLQHCEIDTALAFDGDSFTLTHKNKKISIRLYFVDAPETKNDSRFPNRIKEQASHFYLPSQRVQEIGEAAKRFTESLLKRQYFTVYTLQEDARGTSKSPRIYAFVETSQGDLAELLTKNGLCIVKGFRKRPPFWGGSEYQYQLYLETLAQKARQEKKGGWANTNYSPKKP